MGNGLRLLVGQNVKIISRVVATDRNGLTRRERQVTAGFAGTGPFHKARTALAGPSPSRNGPCS